MFYRITLDLFFPDKDPVDDILDKVKDHLKHAITINPGQDSEEKSIVCLQECYHDEHPSIPCMTTYIWPEGD